MSIAQTILNTVEAMPAGQIFGYQELPGYTTSPAAVIKAVCRMVSDKHLVRFSKGKFYIPKTGLLGVRKPSDSELLHSVLYKNGRLRGYVTGSSLYNQLGLTTQIPRTITVSYNGGRQEKEFGTICIKTIVSRIPIQKKDVKLLQYLDALKDIKKIMGSDLNISIKIMCNYISQLSEREQKRFLKLAINYYSPQVRALVGMLFTSLSLRVPRALFCSLNPTTIYKLKLDPAAWPMAKEWHIR